MAVGVLGGTFDPVHVGHLEVARSVADSLGLSTVVFVPTGDPWQKSAVASREDRFRMTELAIAGDARFVVSRVDVDRPGPTYTVDTLRDLRTSMPHADLHFIVGADALAGLESWHEASVLPSLASFVGVTRPGERFIEPDIPGLDVARVDMPEVDVSSTWVRARVAAGESLEGLVPDPVIAYIRTHGLYQGSE